MPKSARYHIDRAERGQYIDRAEIVVLPQKVLSNMHAYFGVMRLIIAVWYTKILPWLKTCYNLYIELAT